MFDGDGVNNYSLRLRSEASAMREDLKSSDEEEEEDDDDNPDQGEQ